MLVMNLKCYVVRVDPEIWFRFKKSLDKTTTINAKLIELIENFLKNSEKK